SSHTYLHLIQNKDSILESTIHINNNDLSHSLADYIKTLLKKHNIEGSQLNDIYLVYGPGKFSAMRISSVVAKTLSFLFKSKLYILDRFDYYSLDDCICILKSDGGKSFLYEFKNGSKVKEPVLINDIDIKEFVASNKSQIFVYENDNASLVLNKLNRFKEVNDEFTLEYLKDPC
ncbi:MAG: hypothetical protein ACRC4M_01725, partial [Mycoplasma sp.]